MTTRWIEQRIGFSGKRKIYTKPLMTRDLFQPRDQQIAGETGPLADRMRPLRVEELLGQDHLLGEGRFLRECIESDQIPSLILWGPPGVGKTTLARVIAQKTDSHFVAISAVLSGVGDVKRIVKEATYQQKAFGKKTILFVDEIHRFNKAQQDAFLPHVESGRVILIGATTENPSFEVISPLLSRSRVLVLNPLEETHLISILRRALQDRVQGLGELGLEVQQKALEQIAVFANGDARIALNALEVASQLAVRKDSASPRITVKLVTEALQKRMLLYDKSGEEHYNLISALHKSMRNSDADASLYWLGRMLEAGEDPLYIARRMVRFASEDIGLADPQALGHAINAMRAVEFIGLPEGKLALAQLALYLAVAPKSNAVYTAYARVEKDVATTRNEPVPLHLRNAPTQLMKELDYGKGYRYAHHEEARVSAMACLPDQLNGKKYYHPTEEGLESRIRERLQQIEEARGK